MVIPYADMVNHSEQPDVGYAYFPEWKGIAFLALKDIAKGQ